MNFFYLTSLNNQVGNFSERIKMKKFLFTTISFLFISMTAFANDNQDALNTFYNYVKAANSYSNSVADFYSPSAKIIRQVIKPDGTTKNAYTDTATYLKQMKIGQAGAKLKQYKNSYTNVGVTPISAGKVKISSVRHPSCDNDSLKTYMIFQKQGDGKWVIVEEMMQTRQQIFLKYAK